jgi:predicted secreted protein
MKLKFELVNGYGLLIDQEAEIKEGDYVTYQNAGLVITKILNTFESHRTDCNKIIFAEKELGLDIPVFEWRDFEVEKLAIKEFPHDTGMSIVARGAFRKGYKSNPAKYTEEEMEEAIRLSFNNGYAQFTARNMDSEDYTEKYIQSLQKYPKYVVMESELVDSGNHGSGEIFHSNRIEEFTLFTNSEGKQQGIIKKLIWE